MILLDEYIAYFDMPWSVLLRGFQGVFIVGWGGALRICFLKKESCFIFLKVENYCHGASTVLLERLWFWWAGSYLGD